MATTTDLPEPDDVPRVPIAVTEPPDLPPAVARVAARLLREGICVVEVEHGTALITTPRRDGLPIARRLLPDYDVEWLGGHPPRDPPATLRGRS